ncbi:MAG: undecaprenyl-diphosphate phosphatase [Phycisphaeraceae bacterium]|nr:undecaprenyl-diphosphate phosphatase [Phycisphaeraceae bacterium]MCB9847808.1 undecaprenyl-diphosphate phosphatase [Phycisphaeraceae bacterium]
MDLWHAIILGLVEGITEYLPVSSTGHLILTSAFLGLDSPETKQSVDTFSIVIQGGAILAVLGLYRARVIQMIRGLFGKSREGRRLMINLIIAFVPAAVLGVLLDDLIEANLFHTWPVLGALALGGVWMIWLGKGKKHHVSVEAGEPHDASAPQKSIDDITWRTALGIGLFQVVAMWPGTSRSMMTIAGGTLLGLKPKDAAEFSFLLGLPTLGGACVYKLGKNWLETRESGEPNMIEQLGTLPTVVGIVVAMIAAAIAIRWLVSFLNRHGLGVFGWYRIALAAALGGLIVGGLVTIG